jgi:hypothetical protein
MPRNSWLNAKRSHESIVDPISNLPSNYDAGGYRAKARIVEDVIDEMEKQVFVNHSEKAGGARSRDGVIPS